MLGAATTNLPPLVVFADDWGRHPSSCQHLIRHLLGRWQVTWINTIGTRSPGLNLQTFQRGWEKIRHWRRGSHPLPPVDDIQPRVLAPRMWPRFTTWPERVLNRRILSRFLRQSIPELGNAVVLTTLPIVSDLVHHVPARRWVYYCVDDFSTWPGLDARPLREMENSLVAAVDHVVAAGENLAGPLRSRAKSVSLLTHGVDLDFWTTTGTDAAVLDELSRFEPPLILFWGLIDRRLDCDLLSHLGHHLNRGTLLLVGPQQDPDSRLDQVPRLHRLGPRPLGQLPTMAAAAAALIMPYADLPVTRAMQPLKLKEYLATGKPVIATPLPAVQPWQDCLDMTAEPQGFTAAVTTRIQSGLLDRQRAARQRLVFESWAAKSRELEAVLLAEPTADPVRTEPIQPQGCQC